MFNSFRSVDDKTKLRKLQLTDLMPFIMKLIVKSSEKELIGQIDSSADVYFIKQTIGNACGTIGLIHALCNNAAKLGFDSKFLMAFGEAHDESAQEGQTQAPPREDKLDLHFVAFVHKSGKLIELDGRKDGPIIHGSTTEDTLLEDSAEVVKKFMSRDPDSLKFTVIALVKPE
ncbi:hypothetical protein LSH36_14g12000 [Paralvinella palmiformis]|uniref:ubiquitinyl hydrolase 1 n=1 Tax=Paralvinella palmiformis TaxID=53620 RepID=A0AAD9KD03_9ANNE|nr:hypothetical protein LSH36_14g12000 [Paralvinella palmiformis]